VKYKKERFIRWRFLGVMYPHGVMSRESLYLKVVEALEGMVTEALENEEAYRRTQELVNEARDIVARTCADNKPHVGLLLLDCHLAALYSEDGMRDLRKLILAPEEEADWSRAEPGSREFKQRALVFAAKRFAMALAERLGLAEAAEDTQPSSSIPAEESTNAESISTKLTLNRM